MNTCPDLLLRNCSPFLQLCSGQWLWLSLMNTLTQHVPGLFNRRHIRTKCWLRKCPDVLLIQKGLHCSSSVGVGIVALKQPQGGVLLQECHKYRLEHLILVRLSPGFPLKTIWSEVGMQGCGSRHTSIGRGSHCTDKNVVDKLHEPILRCISEFTCVQ